MSDNGKNGTWPFPRPLPVVVATGEYESGKSLLILTTGAPLDRVLVYDNEQSMTLYESMGAFHRVDLVTELSQKYPDGWTNLQFYDAWRDHMRAIEPGQYDVIGVDPIERVESGVADWVAQNPGYFGHTRGQYQSMSGLFWGDVKDLWGRHILEMKARAEMVILTAHMRNVYQGGKPVPGKRERKGKDTLSELATLEVELVRKPGDAAPSAKVLKSRLVYGDLADPSGMRPMFDPWISPFTWARVVEYLKTGADPENPVLPPDDPEEKRMRELELQATIAAAKLAEAEARADAPPAGHGSSPSSGNGDKCPICAATAPYDSEKGHAPWCKLVDGKRVRVEA
jgi:hypothetical protein